MLAAVKFCKILSAVLFNGIVFLKVTNYTTDIFMSDGFDKTQAAKITLIIDGVFLCTTLLCTVIIERAGRRTLLLIGLIGLSVTLIFLTFCPILIVNFILNQKSLRSI
jgi:hypothetical protein